MAPEALFIAESGVAADDMSSWFASSPRTRLRPWSQKVQANTVAVLKAAIRERLDKLGVVIVARARPNSAAI